MEEKRIVSVYQNLLDKINEYKTTNYETKEEMMKCFIEINTITVTLLSLDFISDYQYRTINMIMEEEIENKLKLQYNVIKNDKLESLCDVISCRLNQNDCYWLLRTLKELNLITEEQYRKHLYTNNILNR